MRIVRSMAGLGQRIQTALDEARILILGTQVLLGFEYRAFFEARFAGLPEGARLVKLASISVMLLAFALMVLPGAYHRIVAGGDDRPDVQRFATAVLGLALLPLAIGLGLDVGVGVRAVLGSVAAAGAGAAATGLALAAWYVFTAARRAGRARPPREELAMEPTPLSERIHHVLTEARMVLPGAQALLGFQLAAVLTEPFASLPRASQLVHLASLGAISVAVVLLVTPAAYHRIVLGGEETERFQTVASRLVLGALVALAAGLSGDVYVVFRMVLRSGPAALVAAAGALALTLGLWFGVTLAVRARLGRPSRAARREANA